MIESHVTCPFCSGTGHLPHYRHVQNGDCFACGATGKLRDVNAFIGDNSDIMLTVYRNRGKFSTAVLRRRTWRIYIAPNGQRQHSWGRDSFCRTINDVEEARRIWRDAKRLGIKTELDD